MEATGCRQQWKMHLPEIKNMKFQSPTIKDSGIGDTEGASDREGPHKTVTLAPASRFLTDRQYSVRRSLFSEQYTSILKRTRPQTHTEKEKQFGVAREDKNQHETEIKSPTRAEPTLESFTPSHSDNSSPSASREDLKSPLTVSELRTTLRNEEPPTYESPFSGSMSARRSLSSSFLEVQRLNPPLKPPLTSTVLYPTYSPRSGYTRRGPTQLRIRGSEGAGGLQNKPCFTEGHSKGHPISKHQANYWACAIPKSLPPSPDRHSANWDPNREYEALLDYTYPLRPGQLVSEWDCSTVQRVSKTNPDLEDSGIELDRFCSSSSLSGLGFTVSNTGRTTDTSLLSAGHTSPDFQVSTVSSEGLHSGTQLSQTDPVGLSLDSLDSSESQSGMNQCKRGGHPHQDRELYSSASPAFIRSTSVLPLSRRMFGEADEEFWPLPEQLEELQQLSRQVRKVTAHLRRPVTTSLESLGPGTTSITLPEKQEDGHEEEADVNQDKSEGTSETGTKKTCAVEMADYRESEAERRRRRSGVWEELDGGGLGVSSLREIGDLAEQLCGLTLPAGQRNSQENQEESDSLIQHIQVFCSHLEQLIQQLYSVSERIELLAAPVVSLDSVKSSLASLEYQSFQREVSRHQPLTTSVLHTGRLLLSCINATSPYLRDTLLLIEKKSGGLGTHRERCLSAMDSLTQPGTIQHGREGDSGLVGVQGPTL